MAKRTFRDSHHLAPERLPTDKVRAVSNLIESVGKPEFKELAEQEVSDALKQLQGEFQAMLNVMTDLLIVLDADGRYLEIRGPAKLLQRPAEELLGHTIHEMLPPDVAEQSLNAIHESLEQHQLVTIEYSLTVPSRTWFEARVFPIDEQRVLSSIRNITPSKLAELEIARYAERLRTLHEIDQSILAARSPSTIALAALGRLRRLTGCQRVTALEVDSQGNVAVLGVEAEQEFSTAMQQRVAVINQEILKQGRPAGVEDLTALSQRSPMMELLFQDGTRAFVVIPMLVHQELTGALLLEATSPHAFRTEDVDAALEVASLLAVAIRQARLHTAIEQRAEQLARATQLAQEALSNAQTANRAKSVFLANISHELRTPLNVILGFTQLMTQQADLNAEQRENLTIIERSGEHLLSLINNVLELSKIEAGRAPLQEENFDLHQMLFELEEMFQQRAKKQNLSLVFEWSRDVPRFLRLDQRKLRQILINLLDNAIKFTSCGRVITRVANAIHQIGDASSFLRFEVQDTGPGIAPEEQNAVFAPFWRTEAVASLPGTGLGLAISQQLAQLLGSEITLKSEPGKGCLFSFDVRYTPLSTPGGPGEAIFEVQLAGLEQEVLAVQPDGPVYRILIADDEELSRKLLIKVLAPLGMELREVANGAEALELWQNWQPHLIFMDVRMPVMDGHQLVKHIRQTDGDQKTLIIALTAAAFEEDRIMLLNEGCNDFIRKPFRKTEIYEKLAQHLKLRLVYAEPTLLSPPLSIATAEDETKAWIQALSAQPEEWRQTLRSATINADVHLILECIEQISATEPALAQHLRRFAHEYDHDAILSLLQ